MSPEQARGRAVDKRADVWAFGVVVYEMLSGRRLFDGETVSDVLAAVLTREPDWTALPTSTPPDVERLLRRCLERNPKQRLRDIGEARLVLERGGATEPADRGRPRVASWTRILPWAVAAALAIAVVVQAWKHWTGATPTVAPVRLTVELTDDATLRTPDRPMGPAVVLSPAGDRFVFVTSGTAPAIYTRQLDSLTASPVPGTEGGYGPFFSPDGEWIAFFANGKLKKAALSGGGATVLADAEDPRGGTWLEDGTIVFAPRVETPLFRVPAAGGTPVAITKLDAAADEHTHRWPDGLPGGRGLLYTVSTRTGNYDEAKLVVEGPGGTPRRVLVKGATHGRYLPSGHIVYLHDRTLFAVPFDIDRLALAGTAVPVIQGVAGANVNGGAQFSASRGGLLAYEPTISAPSVLSWLDRSGKRFPLRAQAAAYTGLRLSPQADRVALTIEGQGRSHVWVLDLHRDTLSRLSFNPDLDVDPSWTPDGQRIAYASWQADTGALNIVWQRSDGAGEPQRLTKSPDRQAQGSWHPSGRVFAFTAVRQGGTYDLMILPFEGDGASPRPGSPRPFFSTPFQEQDPEFSPDGRWLAYSSNESGTREVYVRSFPGPGSKWQISSGSGESPRWSRTKPELLYRAGNQLMVVPYSVIDGSFRAGRPGRWGELPPGTTAFDWQRDGERVAFIHPQQETTGRLATRVFVFNFLDELRRRAPRGD